MFQTFIINLDKDVKRLQFMEKQLHSCDITFRRQSGYLGREYVFDLKEYDPKIALSKGGRELILGEAGCALSHAKVIKTIVTEKIPYALVLEDDVEIPKNFKAVIERAISCNTSRQWEYLLFDYIPVGIPFIKQWWKAARSVFSKKRKASFFRACLYISYVILKGFYIIPMSLFERFREKYLVGDGRPVSFYRPVYFAGAYVVSLAGAEKLHALTQPIIYTADQLPNKARVLKDLKFRCYAPLLVHQKRTEFGSSILNLTAKEVQDLLGK